MIHWQGVLLLPLWSQTNCIYVIMSDLVDTLLFQIKVLELPEPVKEYPFTHEIVGSGPGIRKRLNEAGLKNWRFDLAWPTLKIAIECEGGAFVNGGHVRGAYFRDNLYKYGWANFHGWMVYRCDMEMIRKGIAIKHIEGILKRKDLQK